MQHKTPIYIISGASCSGKNFLTSRMIEELNASLIVSSTTREIRKYDNEVDGIHYHFISRDDFLKQVSEGKFIEHEEFSGNLYGTQQSEIDSIIDRGQVPIAIVEPNGNAFLSNKLTELGYKAVSLFVDTSWDVVVDRHVERLIKAVDSGNNKIIQDTLKRMKKSFTQESLWSEKLNYDLKIKSDCDLSDLNSSIDTVGNNKELLPLEDRPDNGWESDFLKSTINNASTIKIIKRYAQKEQSYEVTP